MSQENVEMVQALLERWQRGDYDTAEAFDPQVEFTRTGGGSDVLGSTTKSHGIEGLWAALAAWTEEWSEVRMEAEHSSMSGSVCSSSRGITPSANEAACQ